jgi:hypothetical protein
VDDTVGSVGELGEQALGPGGAASKAVGGLTDAAGQALGPDGAVGQLGGSLGQAVGGAREMVESAAAKIGSPITEKISALAEKVGSDDPDQEMPAPGEGGSSDGDKREQDRQQREQRRRERRRAPH